MERLLLAPIVTNQLDWWSPYVPVAQYSFRVFARTPTVAITIRPKGRV